LGCNGITASSHALGTNENWRRRKTNQVWGRVIGGGCYGGSVTWRWKNGAKAMVFKKKKKRKPRGSWFVHNKMPSEWGVSGKVRKR